MRAALLVPFISGCSIIFVKGPPEGHQKLHYFDCELGGSALAADISGAAIAGVPAIISGSESDSDSGPLTLGAISAAYVASAVYGSVMGSRCRDAKAELSTRIAREHEQHTQRVQELERQLRQQASGCSSDAGCKGSRICLESQCVEPPVVTEPMSTGTPTPPELPASVPAAPATASGTASPAPVPPTPVGP